MSRRVVPIRIAKHLKMGLRVAEIERQAMREVLAMLARR